MAEGCDHRGAIVEISQRDNTKEHLYAQKTDGCRTILSFDSARPLPGRSNPATITVDRCPSDLKSWEGPHLVFSVPDGIWANPADGAWALEVHRYRGKLYLFVTLHNNDKALDEPVPVTHPIYQGKPATHHLRGTQIFIADSPDGPFGYSVRGAPRPTLWLSTALSMWRTKSHT